MYVNTIDDIPGMIAYNIFAWMTYIKITLENSTFKMSTLNSVTHARKHTRTHARAHTHTHTHTHACTHTHTSEIV